MFGGGGPAPFAYEVYPLIVDVDAPLEVWEFSPPSKGMGMGIAFAVGPPASYSMSTSMTSLPLLFAELPIPLPCAPHVPLPCALNLPHSGHTSTLIKSAATIARRAGLWRGSGGWGVSGCL